LCDIRIVDLTRRCKPLVFAFYDTSGRQHFSQLGGSELVDNLLKGRRDGIFVECGAAVGEELSNSLFFELRRNWTGVLIEANPDFLRALLYKNRNAYVVRACLSATTRPQTAKFQLSTLHRGIARNINNLDRNAPVVDVQCFPLNSITAALGMRHVDYLSLDVEGAEPDILKTIDWTQLTVDVITVEYAYRADRLNRLRSLFNATGMFVEVGLLPLGSTVSAGVDVVFKRITK